jgi:parvulin-like peptidyl-prolyl isomerase
MPDCSASRCHSASAAIEYLDIRSLIMSLTAKLAVFVCLVAVAGAPLATAQTAPESKPANPLVQDPGKPFAQQTPARSKTPPPPLVFKNELPKAPVAHLDGKPISQADLLKYLIKGNWATVVQTLILAGMLDIEMKKANITITEEELKEEQDAILQRIAPGKSLEEVKKTNAFSDAEMRRQAWLSRGWDKIFIAEQKLAPGNKAAPENAILKQLFIRQKMEKYVISQRGMEPAPPAGYIAEIREKEGGEVRSITADQALDFLMGLVKPGSLKEAVEDLVDSELVNRELEKAKKTVTEEEVEDWAWSMQERYKPPFDWRMICQFKQTTPDQERERWRRIQAWKRATGFNMTPEELKAFIAKNEDHFSGMSKNVSHILAQTRDRVTDLPPTAEQEAAAKAKIEDLAQKVKEGVDFGYLAEHYSDDNTTAKAKGVLNTPIKKLGGGLDPSFQAEAWKLNAGEVSPPVQSKFGWHLIKCDKVTPGQRGGKDFEEPTYKEWIVDEYETMQMRAWLAALRAKAKIDVVANSELFKLKEMTFGDVKK